MTLYDTGLVDENGNHVFNDSDVTGVTWGTISSGGSGSAIRLSDYLVNATAPISIAPSVAPKDFATVNLSVASTDWCGTDNTPPVEGNSTNTDVITLVAAPYNTSAGTSAGTLSIAPYNGPATTVVNLGTAVDGTTLGTATQIGTLATVNIDISAAKLPLAGTIPYVIASSGAILHTLHDITLRDITTVTADTVTGTITLLPGTVTPVPGTIPALGTGTLLPGTITPALGTGTLLPGDPGGITLLPGTITPALGTGTLLPVVGIGTLTNTGAITATGAAVAINGDGHITIKNYGTIIGDPALKIGGTRDVDIYNSGTISSNLHDVSIVLLDHSNTNITNTGTINGDITFQDNATAKIFNTGVINGDYVLSGDHSDAFIVAINDDDNSGFATPSRGTYDYIFDINGNPKNFSFTSHTAQTNEAFGVFDANTNYISSATSDVTGTAGDDIIVGDHQPRDLGLEVSQHIMGGEGNDWILAGIGNDYLEGGSGNDVIGGGYGVDFLTGGDGDDWLSGGSENDNLEGGSGDDFLLGGSGDDRLDGGSGDDRLDGGSGNDVLSGGTGVDKFVISPANSTTTINDFNAANETIDISNLAGRKYFKSIKIEASGADTQITLEDNQVILLKNVSPDTITQNNFVGLTSAPPFIGTVEPNSTEVNTPPTANDDFITLSEGNPADTTWINDGWIDDKFTILANDPINFIDVLSNDRDPDASDDLKIISLETDLTKQAVIWNGNSVAFSPDSTSAAKQTILYSTARFNYLAEGETATDVVKYTISDGHGGTSTATLNITIKGENDGPTANDDFITLSEQGSTYLNNPIGLIAQGDTLASYVPVLNFIDVLSNDTDPDRSDVLRIASLDTSATKGSATIFTNGLTHRDEIFYDQNGKFAYLAEGETAIDTVKYTISDGHGGTSTATLNITITGTGGNEGLIVIDNQAKYVSAVTKDATGTAGDDVIVGASTQGQHIMGGQGNDQVIGLSGNDNLEGGSGNDILRGGAGDDRLAGGDGDDKLYGGSGKDVLSGGNGKDLLSGGSGNDNLDGGNGNDRLDGGSGNDKLDGGKGNDILTGGAGVDKLTGGSGMDVFRYDNYDDSYSSAYVNRKDPTLSTHHYNYDTITDFTQGEDKIDLVALHTYGIDSFSDLNIVHTGNETIISAGYSKGIGYADYIGAEQAYFELHLAGDIDLKDTDFLWA